MAEGHRMTAADLGPDHRQTQRNGYRQRRWDTRVGELKLAIPRLRTGSYFPSFLEPRRWAEQALVAVVQEAHVNGIAGHRLGCPEYPGRAASGGGRLRFMRSSDRAPPGWRVIGGCYHHRLDRGPRQRRPGDLALTAVHPVRTRAGNGYGPAGPVAAGGRTIEARSSVRAVEGMRMRPRVGRSRSKVTRSSRVTSAAASSTVSTPRPRIVR
jgi:Transposase, Mutator family